MCRHVYRYAHRHVCRHVHRHVCTLPSALCIARTIVSPGRCERTIRSNCFCVSSITCHSITHRSVDRRHRMSVPRRRHVGTPPTSCRYPADGMSVPRRRHVGTPPTARRTRGRHVPCMATNMPGLVVSNRRRALSKHHGQHIYTNTSIHMPIHMSHTNVYPHVYPHIYMFTDGRQDRGSSRAMGPSPPHCR